MRSYGLNMSVWCVIVCNLLGRGRLLRSIWNLDWTVLTIFLHHLPDNRLKPLWFESRNVCFGLCISIMASFRTMLLVQVYLSSLVYLWLLPNDTGFPALFILYGRDAFLLERLANAQVIDHDSLNFISTRIQLITLLGIDHYSFTVSGQW